MAVSKPQLDDTCMAVCQQDRSQDDTSNPIPTSFFFFLTAQCCSHSRAQKGVLFSKKRCRDGVTCIILRSVLLAHCHTCIIQFMWFLHSSPSNSFCILAHPIALVLTRLLTIDFQGKGHFSSPVQCSSPLTLDSHLTSVHCVSESRQTLYVEMALTRPQCVYIQKPSKLANAHVLSLLG